jgi:hypothetical protein
VALGDKKCVRCGKAFGCGRAAGENKCWCEDLPPSGLPADPAADCLCPDCLKAECDKRR